MAGDGPEAGLVVVVLGDHLRKARVAEAPGDPAPRGQRLDLREIISKDTNEPASHEKNASTA